jgi:hypothetical protein
MSKKRKHKKHFKPYIPKGDEFPIESDHYFAFIMGYTSGGAAYGITHEEWKMIQEEEKKTARKPNMDNRLHATQTSNH